MTKISFHIIYFIAINNFSCHDNYLNNTLLSENTRNKKFWGTKILYNFMQWSVFITLKILGTDTHNSNCCKLFKVIRWLINAVCIFSMRKTWRNSVTRFLPICMACLEIILNFVKYSSRGLYFGPKTIFIPPPPF